MENWFETEGSINRENKRVHISQKDTEPLEKIRRALEKELGISEGRIYTGKTAGALQLPIEDSAKFVRHFKNRVKTEKARADLEELERLILAPAKVLTTRRMRARNTLLLGRSRNPDNLKYRRHNISHNLMINPYEIVSKSALPALRAMVAKRLCENYKMTQQEAAGRLGITQASVSNYARKARGVMVDLESEPTVARAADLIAATLSGDNPDKKKALKIMTDVCDYVRYSHLMCDLHRDLDPEFNVHGCEACEGAFSGKDFERLKVTVG